jgi:hypothetical protein
MPTETLPVVSYRARRLFPAALPVLAALLLLALLPVVRANADEPPEAAKLLASDGAAGDRFGAAVAIDGDTALVGGYRDDEACPSDPDCDSGSAYVFQRQADRSWSQSAKLIPDDGVAGDAFGAAVALSGDTALIGAYGDGDNGANSGSAYVFQRGTDGTWTQSAKLIPDDGDSGDWFGYAVALEGNTALIGAFLDSNGGTYLGSAYIFQRQSDGRWIEMAKVVASDGAPGDWFGSAVALSGDSALIGAPGDATHGSQAGAAYLFQRMEEGTWTQVARLVADEGTVDAWFGTAVALEGDFALIGASGDVENGFHAGAAYVFQRQAGGTWTQQAKLMDGDGAAGDYFGEVVALSGDTALIGASGDDVVVCPSERSCYSGSAYLFQRQVDGTWTQTTRLAASDGAAGDWFGSQVALSGASALVGARGDDDACTSSAYCDSGSAYLFESGAPANGVPRSDAGGPYAGDEGAPISLAGARATDPENESLAFAWRVSDPGICAFDDASALHSSLICGDDGTFSVTLEVSDGANPAVSSQPALVTVSNLAPRLGANRSPLEVGQHEEIAGVTFSVSDVAADPLIAASSWSSDGVTFRPGLPGALQISSAGCGSDGRDGSCSWLLHGEASMSPGIYVIQVTVDDGDGGFGYAQATVVVETGNPALAVTTAQPAVPAATGASDLEPAAR